VKNPVNLKIVALKNVLKVEIGGKNFKTRMNIKKKKEFFK
jgi:hypothetical protein